MKNLDLKSEEIGPRLKAIRTALKCTVGEFYKPLMKSINNGSAIENNKRRLGPRLAKDIITHYQINPVFLSTGQGEMFLSGKQQNQRNTYLQTLTAQQTVPYYDMNLTETGGHSQSDVFCDHAPKYYVDYQPLNDCTAYLPVYGNSMYPLFTSGEIIAVKAVANPEVILWGEAYLVVTNELANDTITIRQLHQHNDPDKIILRAANPAYNGDTVIAKNAIKKLYLIKGKITRFQL